eukprot:1457107-Amphidinium_carterae.1
MAAIVCSGMKRSRAHAAGHALSQVCAVWFCRGAVDLVVRACFCALKPAEASAGEHNRQTAWCRSCLRWQA